MKKSQKIDEKPRKTEKLKFLMKLRKSRIKEFSSNFSLILQFLMVFGHFKVKIDSIVKLGQTLFLEHQSDDTLAKKK